MKEISKSTYGVSVMTDGETFGVYGEQDDFHGFPGGWLVEHTTEEEASEIASEEESRRTETAEDVQMVGGTDAAEIKEAVEAVEDNNRSNGAQWSDWGDAGDVEDAYNLSFNDSDRKVIERAISTNGESLKSDLPAIERLEHGQNFAGSFWDRS